MSNHKGPYTVTDQQEIVPQSHSPTILVVDDEPAITKLCTSVLQQANFSVLHAHDTSEALKIITRHKAPIDLLLTDLVLHPPLVRLRSHSIQFPYVHGHELAARALCIRKELRVILMSGYVARDLLKYGIRQWKLPFIAKPFKIDALVALVQQTLQTPPHSVDSLIEEPPGIPKIGDGWVD